MGSDGGGGLNGECSSLLDHKDEMCDINALEPASWRTMPSVNHFKHASHLNSFCSEDASIAHTNGSASSALHLVVGQEAMQSQRKSGKVSRNSSSSSRRSRLANFEISVNVAGSVDRSSLQELGSDTGKCNLSEKMQTDKQRSNSAGKRGDKRNGKVQRSKHDSFSVKAGFSSLYSVAAGNSIPGVSSSKADICDFTKNMDELSLNELLDGSYKCPTFVKDKGKKASNSNENILQSVREVCSFLRPPKQTQPQKVTEIDGNHNQVVSSCLASSNPSGASRSDDEKLDMADQSSFEKVQDSCIDSSSSILELPLYTPNDILDRLLLPPSKDLDVLLLDGMKPTSSSKSCLDLRLGKPVLNRCGLSTFSWSHISGVHSKSNPDAVKVSTSRTTCQGRWVRVGDFTSSLGSSPEFLADFESLTYNENLVPSECRKLETSENGKSPSASVSTAPLGPGVSSRITSFPDGHCPTVLAAAQILFDMASSSLKHDQNVMKKWQKKPSQKAMRDSKSVHRSEKEFAASEAKRERENFVTGSEICSNNLKLSVNEKSSNLARNGSLLSKLPLQWPTSRSGRSSQCKPFQDFVCETKHSCSNNTEKKRFLTPPPRRVSDKGAKVRKLATTGWNESSFRKLD